ncbi:MAG: hypothetical protein HQ581_09465 [Planctomycetes bacterium]|nr:hypothetical protein [Planctomycetota bacterium]
MPPANRFRHQAYQATRPASPYHLLVAPTPPADDGEFRRRMQQAGDTFRRAGVAAIYLVHGTFVGSDAMGVLAGLARVFPAVGRQIQKAVKQAVDQLAGEEGNYAVPYARTLEDALADPGGDRKRIPVRLFGWSGENHHLGRACAAVRLIDELASPRLAAGRRVLLWGHSHAGNVLALITNLLADDTEAVGPFFDAARSYSRRPLFSRVDLPFWGRVEEWLRGRQSPLPGVALDLVTFGTPIRYGWDSTGYARLLHFVNHRPVGEVPDYRAPFPPKPEDLLAARGGDYIQQLGIAGTNVMPNPLFWRTWTADRRLGRLLQAGLRKRDLIERFRAGAIVPDEGTTLLVDYGPQTKGIARDLVGHAVYTRKQWMLFHAEEVARRFYETETNGRPA